MGDENLKDLLAKRAPKRRSKLTTTLAAILILLIGIFLGAMMARGTTAGTPGAPAISSGP